MLTGRCKILFALAYLCRFPRRLGGEACPERSRRSKGEGSAPKIAGAVGIAGSLCVIFLWLLLSQSVTHADELRRILYGTTASASHLPIWVAKDAGYFEKAGFNLEPVQIRGGSLITLAIITGNLPFSGVGAESVIAARAAGGDVVLLACPVDADPVYLITRPEIKSAAELKGQASAVTRYGSTTHFYLRAALKHVGLNPDRDMTILQMGAGPEMVAALESGRIAAAALTTRYAAPFLQRGWPVLVDLSTTDMVYPSSCVTSSRAFIRAEPKTTEDFLRAYVAGIDRIKRDLKFAEKSFAKWLREKDPLIVKQSVGAYARLFKRAPFVPDKGIENVVKDLMRSRPEFKEYLNWPEPFRENRPLEKVLKEK
jgi:NitT/TauT family transport system substrate-binding protein